VARFTLNKNDDGAGKDDLPLEMTPIRFMGTHACGRVSYGSV